jgi:hypothetical protein
MDEREERALRELANLVRRVMSVRAKLEQTLAHSRDLMLRIKADRAKRENDHKPPPRS